MKRSQDKNDLLPDKDSNSNKKANLKEQKSEEYYDLTFVDYEKSKFEELNKEYRQG